jgi:hypothetical protein
MAIVSIVRGFNRFCVQRSCQRAARFLLAKFGDSAYSHSTDRSAVSDSQSGEMNMVF